MTRRIAIVAPNYYPLTCGVGDHSMRLAAELGRLGNEVAIFTRGQCEPNPEAPDVPVFGCGVGSTRTLARRIYSAILEWRPTELLVQYTPNMLDATRLGSLAVPFLVRRARHEGFPVTVVAHELCTPWAMRPDLAVAALAHRLMLALLLSKASTFAVTTEARRRRVLRLARLVRRSDGVGTLRVGPSAVPAARNALKPPQPRIGTFSTLMAGKRFDTLLDAFSIVGREEPEARLILIGDLARANARAYRGLLDAIEHHPLRDRVELTGKLSLARISSVVGSLTAYFHPDDIGVSSRSSTLPLAFGAGVPVIGARGIETDSLFVDGENVAFASLEPAAVAKAILRAIRDPMFRERVSSGGRHLYEQHLSWSVIAADFLELARASYTDESHDSFAP